MLAADREAKNPKIIFSVSFFCFLGSDHGIFENSEAKERLETSFSALEQKFI